MNRREFVGLALLPVAGLVGWRQYNEEDKKPEWGQRRPDPDAYPERGYDCWCHRVVLSRDVVAVEIIAISDGPAYRRQLVERHERDRCFIDREWRGN